MLPFALSPSLSLSPFRRFIINFRENFSIGFNYGESTASLKLDVSFYHSSVLGLNPFTPREDMPFRGKNRTLLSSLHHPSPPPFSLVVSVEDSAAKLNSRQVGRKLSSSCSSENGSGFGERKEREEKRKEREIERRREGGK